MIDLVEIARLMNVNLAHVTDAKMLDVLTAALVAARTKKSWLAGLTPLGKIQPIADRYGLQVVSYNQGMCNRKMSILTSIKGLPPNEEPSDEEMGKLLSFLTPMRLRDKKPVNEYVYNLVVTFVNGRKIPLLSQWMDLTHASPKQIEAYSKKFARALRTKIKFPQAWQIQRIETELTRRI